MPSFHCLINKSWCNNLWVIELFAIGVICKAFKQQFLFDMDWMKPAKQNNNLFFKYSFSSIKCDKDVHKLTHHHMRRWTRYKVQESHLMFCFQTGCCGGCVITGRYSSKDLWQIDSSIALLRFALTVLRFWSIKEATHAHATSCLEHHSNQPLLSVVLKCWKNGREFFKVKPY